jgi:hypothetical protein
VLRFRVTRGVVNRSSWLVALCIGCSASRASVEPPALSQADFARRWIKLYVPNAGGAPYLARTDSGFVALSSESLGAGKVVAGVQNYVYRSEDGVRWKVMFAPRATQGLGWQGIAYGDGRFVSVGGDLQSSQIWTSLDARSWSATVLPARDTNFHWVEHVNDRFFVFGGSSTLATSADAKKWSLVTLGAVQVNDLAFGNGRYVVVGSGPIHYSDDGESWKPAHLDCGLPGACITDPSGGMHQGGQYDVVFADRFYADQLFSPDGERWSSHSYPSAEISVGGYLIGRSTFRTRHGLAPDVGEREQLLAWKPGGSIMSVEVDTMPASTVLHHHRAPPPAIEARLPGGANCLNRRCVTIKEAIYLIP